MKKLLFTLFTLLTALQGWGVAQQTYTDPSQLPAAFSFDAVRNDYLGTDDNGEPILVHTQTGITVTWNPNSYSSFSGSYGSLTITNFYSHYAVKGQADLTFNNRSNRNFQWIEAENCIVFSFPAYYYSNTPKSDYSYAAKYSTHKYAYLGLANRKVTPNGSSDWFTGESTYYGWSGGTIECRLYLDSKTIEINQMWGCFMMTNTSANNSTVLEVFDYSVFREKEPTTLAWIENAANGELNQDYTVADQLVCVYAQDGSLWCKDQGNLSNVKSTNPGNTDYMKNLMFEMHGRDLSLDWDQSNWVELDFGDVTEERAEEIYDTYVGRTLKAGTVKGKYVDNINYRIELSADPEVDGDLPYSPNYYCPVNFMGSTDVTIGNDKKFYFLNPKVQEYALVTVAVWKGGNVFVVPAKDEEQGVNVGDMSGAFNVNWDLNCWEENTIVPVLNNKGGEAYEFHAIIRKPSSSPSSAPAHATSVTPKDVTPTNDYLLYPLDLTAEGTQIVTGITTVCSDAVDDGYYYTITGQRVSHPGPGFYIRGGKKVIVR